MSEPALRDLLDVAVEAALAGGKRTLRYFNAGVAVEWKADGSPLTAADRESEAEMRRIIGRAFPDHTILGEEEGETAGTAPVRWIIDPLDGTRTFVRGVPLYGTLVGVEVRDEPVVGVIHLPALDETLAAARGQGCTWNGRPCRVSATDGLDRALLVVTDERVARGRSGAYDRLVAATAMQRTWADCYGYALVATGRAAEMVDPVVEPYDVGPMPVILAESGGRFTDSSGVDTIEGGSGVGSNGVLHAEILAALEQ